MDGRVVIRVWRWTILLLVLFILCPACKSDSVSTLSSAPIYHLVLLHTNDTHGHPLKFPFGPGPDAGGLPARASLVKQIRNENRNVLLLDAGDINTGRSESNLFNARPDIEGYNFIGYDAMALGNHEFDHPLPILREQMSLARFPFLSSNLRSRDGAPFTHSYIIKEFPGFKVAIFGLTLKETPSITNPAHVKDLVFLDEIETARNLVPRLRQEADLVIALTHLGIFDTPERGSRRLASEVSGIDLIVDGHTHTWLESPLIIGNPEGGRTLLVQAGKWGLFLGRLDLWLQGGRIKNFRFEEIPINTVKPQRSKDRTPPHTPPGNRVPEDPLLLNMLQPYATKAASRLSEVIGFAEATFSSRNTRNEETAIGNLIADSIQWFGAKWEADFAVQNGGGIRQDLSQGEISLKSIYDMIPFDNSICILTLDGTEVKGLFDFIGAIQAGSGAFPQFSKEIKVVLNRETGKCEKVFIHGRPIDPGRTYKVATNSYLAAGGDDYTVFPKAKERFDTAVLLQPILIEYIKTLGGRLSPAIEGRITFRP